MADLNIPSFITPTITIGGATTTGKPLQVGALKLDMVYVDVNYATITHTEPNVGFYALIRSSYLNPGDVVNFEFTETDLITKQTTKFSVSETYRTGGVRVPLTLGEDVSLTGYAEIPRYKHRTNNAIIESVVTIILTHSVIGSDVLLNETVPVIRKTFNLLDYCLEVLGRIPTGRVRFINTRQVIVGKKDAIIVGDWPTTTKLELINDGWIFGEGGEGGSIVGPNVVNRNTTGGIGITGGNVKITVQNNGVISGGGGGGAAGYAWYGETVGGGGAPYGVSGNIYGNKIVPDATLTVPGDPTPYYYPGARAYGGEIGKPSNAYPAGLTYTGDVEIINIGTGHTGYL